MWIFRIISFLLLLTSAISAMGSPVLSPSGGCEEALSAVSAVPDAHLLWRGIGGPRRKILLRALLSKNPSTKDQDLRSTFSDQDSRWWTNLENVFKQSRERRWWLAYSGLKGSGLEASPPGHTSRSLWRKIGRTSLNGLQSIAKTVGWLVNPVPVQINLFKSKVQTVYLKAGRVSFEHLTLREKQILEEAQLAPDYIKLDEARRQRSEWHIQSQKWGDRLWNLTLKSAQVSALFGMLLSFDAGGTQTVDSYLASASAADVQKVEIFLDTPIFSHSAIRIGSQVYSPGQATLGVWPVYEYVMVGPRSLKAISLNVTPGEGRALRRYFEERLWHKYNNHTGFYDCTTVIADALRQVLKMKIPPVVDASPTLFLSWLRMQGLVGDRQIGEMRTLGYANTISSYGGYQAIQSLEASIESKIFFLMAPGIYGFQETLREDGNLIVQTEALRAEEQALINSIVKELGLGPLTQDLRRSLKVVRLRSEAGMDTQMESMSRISELEGAFENYLNTVAGQSRAPGDGSDTLNAYDRLFRLALVDFRRQMAHEISSLQEDVGRIGATDRD